VQLVQLGGVIDSREVQPVKFWRRRRQRYALRVAGADIRTVRERAAEPDRSAEVFRHRGFGEEHSTDRPVDRVLEQRHHRSQIADDLHSGTGRWPEADSGQTILGDVEILPKCRGNQPVLRLGEREVGWPSREGRLVVKDDRSADVHPDARHSEREPTDR